MNDELINHALDRSKELQLKAADLEEEADVLDQLVGEIRRLRNMGNETETHGLIGENFNLRCQLELIRSQLEEICSRIPRTGQTPAQESAAAPE